MALFQVNFYSKALAQNTSFNVILPESCPRSDIPTVYLLHGMFGDHTDWCRRTGIERYADKRRVAVVMPDGENSFYADMKYGKKYFTYVSEELVAYTRRVFRLSRKREKTFVCGLSMGGYGAFLLALRKPEQYGACASLSGCVDIAEVLEYAPDPDAPIPVWGEDFRTSVKGSVSDLKWLVENFPKDAPKPRMFSVCGRQDSLYQNCLGFRDFMEDKDFSFTYREGDGAHTWGFWDAWICPALDFLLER